MSNYNCPQCGKAIIDIPYGKSDHICEYVPYSIRNNIKDEKLGQVLNYLERVTGWDILCEEGQNESSITNAANGVNIRVGHYMDWVHIDDGNFQVIYESTLDIFYGNYTGVLPYIKTFLQKNAKKTLNS